MYLLVQNELSTKDAGQTYSKHNSQSLDEPAKVKNVEKIRINKC